MDSAEKGERTAGRVGYRSGYYGRTLITRIGKLELRVPQDRTGRFSTELFERYQRSERALVAALAEMYVQGVSTRKVKAITEELCGHSFSASSISAMNQRLDASLAQFASRPLAEAFPYLILDARYERVREAGVITSQAVLIAIGIDWDGRRQVLAVELANRESRSSWRDFLLGISSPLALPAALFRLISNHRYRIINNPFWLPPFGPAIRLPQQKPAVLCRDRWFESISLRQRVSSEPNPCRFGRMRECLNQRHSSDATCWCSPKRPVLPIAAWAVHSTASACSSR
jgi:putative transposase